MTETERLQYFADRVSYDPLSGDCVWLHRLPITRGDKVFNTKFAGKVAGGVRPDGYIGIVANVNGHHESVLAHRLAWFISTGEAPEAIDHADHVRNNNTLSNLTAATREVNNKNQSRRSDNKTGATGVYWSPQHSKFRAVAQTKSGRVHIGLFDTVDEAAAARAKVSVEMGFHKNHGAACE